MVTGTGDKITPLKTTAIKTKEELDAVFRAAAGEVTDSIHKPTHYTSFKIEPIYFIMQNELDFATGNVIKYTLRHRMKNGKEDLKKAIRYLEMIIDSEY
tara:strand:+ start:1166 stop:1462 length:297 start_codon:yes stop_codon:yes gene_type:complete